MLKDRLILLRREKGYSQYEVAERLGFSRGKLANYEQGTRQPDYDTLEIIADFYDVSTDYLLGRTDNPSFPQEEEQEDSLEQINKLLKKYNIDQSGFFDIEKWKSMGPEEIKQLESYFQFIVSEAEKKNKDKNTSSDTD
ncbi:helix-turn-helix domain-containing protein [Oceanobacillus alkalisoli]|uniref:helix-turn-helix domain-containing protein n=1 Tax=Oceanobacillus alkalisoli TaxID=2925113 RepID=UPI001F11C68A|nr:helix-turn-helix domain-containing protein [Oceanobacillus alkalisoli]MCF3941602.1 helix-turn-helix domain-containing protein [Oceanobacillus alkalisoli]